MAELGTAQQMSTAAIIEMCLQCFTCISVAFFRGVACSCPQQVKKLRQTSTPAAPQAALACVELWPGPTATPRQHVLLSAERGEDRTTAEAWPRYNTCRSCMRYNRSCSHHSVRHCMLLVPPGAQMHQANQEGTCTTFARPAC